MGPTIEQVTAAIEDVLGPGGEVHLYVEDGRVGGFVAHPAFSRYSVPERREFLRGGLSKHFQLDQIGILLLYSPEEYREIAS